MQVQHLMDELIGKASEQSILKPNLSRIDNKLELLLNAFLNFIG